jgi:pimeloyl-ACP methyl ester carboxylesterase
MPFYEKNKTRIYYEEAGSGFPLFVIYGGGLNSGITNPRAPFDALETFKDEYRVIAMDLRNANGGKSTGPLETDRPWAAHAEDQLGLLDYLGVSKFHVMGFCIGNPLLWNLLTRAPGRIVSAVSAQPSGVVPQNPSFFYTRNLSGWASKLVASRADITMEMAEKFLSNMYKNVDFVITASRDFVRNCQTPLLVMPDNTEAHPYATAMEMVELAPNAQMTFYPWQAPTDDGNAPSLSKVSRNVKLAVRHVQTFLKAHTPTTR